MPNSNFQINLLRFSSLFVFLFTLISIIFNVHELYFLKEPYPFYNYMQNEVIRTIYHVTIILEIIIAISSILMTAKIEEAVSWQFMFPVISISIILSSLIWYEIYFDSTFYYGEVRDKHFLFVSANSFGVYGSTVFLNYALLLSIFKNAKFMKSKSILIMVLGISVYVIQYSFYKLMEVPWRLWLS